MTKTALTSAVAVALAMFGCSPAQPRVMTQTAHILVEETAGAPIAGAAITHDGQVVGKTAPDGRTQLQMVGRDGDAFRVHVSCPEGFEPATAVDFEVLVRRADGAAPEFAARCGRRIRRATVAIQTTNGPNLPVLFLGKEIGRTDPSGQAKLTIDALVKTDVELVLDTRGAKNIHPAMPTLTFQMRDGDEAVVLEQKFSVDKPRTARPVPTRRGPTRIGS